MKLPHAPWAHSTDDLLKDLATAPNGLKISDIEKLTETHVCVVRMKILIPSDELLFPYSDSPLNAKPFSLKSFKQASTTEAS